MAHTYARAYISAFVFVNSDLERGGSGGGARVKRRVSSRDRETGGFS